MGVPHSEGAQASNALVGDNIPDTLENCAVVLAFLSEFHSRNAVSELSDRVEAGLVSVIHWVEDAIAKQAEELEVDHHG